MTPTHSGVALHAANRRGVLAMTGAMASFIVNDCMVKYVSQSLPATQLIFLRGLMSIALLLAVAHALGATRRQSDGNGGLRQLVKGPVLLRSGFDAVATLIYLASLFHLQLGIATAINMATPLFMTLFAISFWGEQVGRGRWLAIAIGFAGVLLVVQPQAEGFNAWTLLCLMGTLFHAARDLSTRRIGHNVPSILITLSTAVAVTLLAGLLGVAQDWLRPSLAQLGLLAAASVFLSIGYFLLIQSMRAGEMSVIAPFRYTGLLFALAMGWMIWGDVPNAIAWAGIALLAGAGLYMLHSERARTQAALEAAQD